jgi:haloacid dehalogenase superfamily, subfamily IA, variant 3 with third motif having DD or ED/haloacid dehalogenase superfamily, subfamily IA, variant 1 with third motif having Dx(3-4)D or Dx(3-4)E
MPVVEAIVFDVGETLVDETRAWGVWAEWLGVPALTLAAALGAIIARGGSHREVFELFRPGMDVEAEARRLGVSGRSDLMSLDDLYPDALECLRQLAADGYRLGVAANQPAPAAGVLRAMGIDFELVATSQAWGISKPDPAFFARIATELGLPPAAIAYVGDRLDNDIGPAHAAGMVAVFVRRGPWGWIQAGRTDPPEADLVVESLAELPIRLRRSPFGRTGS